MRRIVTVRPTASKGVGRSSPGTEHPQEHRAATPDILGCRPGRVDPFERLPLPERRRRTTVKKILVGTDTSASADTAVREAARLASVDDAELLVLHVRSEASARDAVDPKK